MHEPGNIEKVHFTNSRNLRLAGSFFDAPSDRGVVMAHGFCGDRSHHGRFDALGEALQKKHISALSFDFSGCGESDFDTINIEKEEDDMRAAIQWLRRRGKKRIGLLGYSLGGLIAARVCTADIACLVLWAPVTRTKNDPRSGFSSDELEELDMRGQITKTASYPPHSRMIIDASYLLQRKIVDQKSLLERIACPVLIVHGEADKKQPLENSVESMEHLSEASKLEIIAGGEHNLINAIEQCIDLSQRWFTEYL